MKIPPLISYLGKSVGFGLAMAALFVAGVPRFSRRRSLPGLITNARELSFSYAAHRAGPAVVNIYTRSFAGNRGEKPNSDPGLGSGVIMNQRGHVLTNYHVIADADQIIVALQDGRVFSAELVGTDKLTDLAVLYIESDNLPVIPRTRIVCRTWETWCRHRQPLQRRPDHHPGHHQRHRAYRPLQHGAGQQWQTGSAANRCRHQRGQLGGALVNGRGDLVGINTAAYHLNGNQESYGIPVLLSPTSWPSASWTS